MAVITITPVSVPSDQGLPTSAQALVNLVAGYLGISGLEGVEGVIVSAVEPAPEDRSKLWVKKDAATERTIGFYTYRGGWNAVPVVIPSGTKEPSGPQVAELFFNTAALALKLYRDGQWTTNTWPRGSTSDRPENPAISDLYYDTDISRLLIYKSEGWTTVDGAVGDLKPVTGVSEEDAKTRNPGWSVYEGLAGRFPMGRDDDHKLDTSGGRASFFWNGTSGPYKAGDDRTAISSISIDSENIKFRDKASTGTESQTSSTFEVEIIPQYRAVLWMRKDF